MRPIRPRTAVPLATLLVGLAFLAWLLTLSRGLPAAPAGADPYVALALIRLSPPTAAKAFSVPLLAGGTASLDDYRGRVVFLNFWATWCVPCREEMPAIERLNQRLAAKGLAVLAVSIDTGPEAEAVRRFVAEHRLTFPIGLDPSLRVVDLYGIRALPATFLVDRRGRVLAQALGPREWDGPDAVSFVERLLAGR